MTDNLCIHTKYRNDKFYVQFQRGKVMSINAQSSTRRDLPKLRIQCCKIIKFNSIRDFNYDITELKLDKHSGIIPNTIEIFICER